jgi:membrane-bound lytic murein transglycosylase D
VERQMTLESIANTAASYPSMHAHLQVWLIRSILIIIIAGGMHFVFDGHLSVSAQAGSVHVVQPGENLTVIAKRYGVNMYDLARYNDITNLNFLRVNQVLYIPATNPSRHFLPQINFYNPEPDAIPYQRAETPDSALSAHKATATLRIYTVRRGDSLFGIARRFGVSIQALKLRNGLQGDLIRVGQRLIIP